MTDMPTFLAWADAGGPVLWALCGLSVLSLALIAVKLFDVAGALAGAARRESALRAWAAGDAASARSFVFGGRTPPDRLMLYAMDGLAARMRRPLLEAELERRGNAEIARLSRYLRLLELIASAAPLLGLLGTVLGMIQSFQGLESAKGGANAAVLAGGIWEALLTTAAGLVVAIPAMAAAALITARVDRIGQGLEEAVGALWLADAARGG